MNLREKGTRAALRFPRFHILSWNVPQVPAGPPRDRCGNISQTARDFEIFLRGLVKMFPWSILCLQVFQASNGEVVTETSEGHRVFATPPCKGQLRLAIVVSTEVLTSVKMDSLCVKGRNCSLDVAWEGNKFRAVCSHLSAPKRNISEVLRYHSLSS